MADQQDAQTPPENTPYFHVERLYLKDLSFESPSVPDSFNFPEEPKVEFNLDSGAKKIGDNHFEVELSVTVKVTAGEKNMFLVEAVHAGLFLMRNIPEQQVPMLLGIECPSILFPYLRQVISETIINGGFKPLVLDPINFAALYHQAQQEQQQPPAGASN